MLSKLPNLISLGIEPTTVPLSAAKSFAGYFKTFVTNIEALAVSLKTQGRAKS